MRKKIVVYRHIRNDTNEVFYIGIGKTEKRAHSLHNRNKYWKNIVNSVGHTVEIIHRLDNYERAKELEIELIKYYGRKDLNEGTLVNMTDGGEGGNGCIRTSESRRKQKENHSDFNGILNPMYGKCHSEETKMKMSNSQKQWLTTNTHSWKGKNHSDETKEKMSKNQLGKSNSFYGKTHSEETKAKMRAARKKQNNDKRK